MRQRESLPLRPGGQQQRRHGRGLPDADRAHIRPDKLHRIIDAHSRRDRTARRVDVQRNILLRIFGFQKQHLGRDQVRHIIVNGRTDKDDIVFQQARIDVIRALAAAGLLDHHWN